MEDFSIEIINKNSKNILISTQYKDPLSKSKIFEEYLKKFCQQNQNKKQTNLYCQRPQFKNPLDHNVNANLKTYM